MQGLGASGWFQELEETDRRERHTPNGRVGSNTPLSAARPTFNLQEGKNGDPAKTPEAEISPHNPRLSGKQSATPTAAARPGLGNRRGTSPGFLIQFLQDSGLHWPTHRFWLELC